tara:strand:+ start:796 stop:1245 length:450 start_codon:yes stop_codon:yes gene_type:complete
MGSVVILLTMSVIQAVVLNNTWARNIFLIRTLNRMTAQINSDRSQFAEYRTKAESLYWKAKKDLNDAGREIGSLVGGRCPVFSFEDIVKHDIPQKRPTDSLVTYYKEILSTLGSGTRLYIRVLFFLAFNNINPTNTRVPTNEPYGLQIV